MDNPSWMGQRNAWQDQMRGGNMGDSAFRQQMFDQRDAWQQARNSWQQQNPNSPYAPQGGMTPPSPPVAAPSQPSGWQQPPQNAWANLRQNWYQQNQPAISSWFQQHMGMQPTGLFPFNPTGFPNR